MITQEQKEKEAKAIREETIRKAEEEILLGQSAVRLEANTDWQKIKRGHEAVLKQYEESEILLYRDVVADVESDEQAVVAIHKCRLINKAIYDLRFFLSETTRRIEAGERAKEYLAQIYAGEGAKNA